MPEQGAFMSFLDWLDRPGQVVRNVLSGRPEEAGRHFLDIFGKPLDALLPGDVIPDAAEEDDFVSGSDLAGVQEPGVGKFGADVVLGALTDPLTYVGAGLVTAPLKAGAKATGKALLPAAERILGAERVAAGLTAGRKAIGTAGRRVRDVFGSKAGLTPAVREILERSEREAAATGAAQGAAAERLAKLLPDEADRELAYRLQQNYAKNADGTYRVLDETSLPLAPTVDDIAAGGLPVAPGSTGTTLKAPRYAGVDEGLQAAPESLQKAVPALDEALGVRGVADAGEGINAAAARALDAEPERLVRESREVFRDSNKLYMEGAGDIKKVAPEPKPLGEPQVKMPQVDPLTGAPILPDAVQGTVRPTVASFDTVEGHLARLEQRMDAMGVTGAQRDRMRAYFQERLPVVQRQYRELVESGAFYKPQGIDPVRQMPLDYVHRQFQEVKPSGLAGDGIGTASAGKARDISATTPEALVAALNKGDKKLVEDIAKADLDRAAQQASLVKGARVASEVIKDAATKARAKRVAGQALSEVEEKALAAEGKAFAEQGVSSTFSDLLDDMVKQGNIEDAEHLRRAVFGMGKRSAPMEFLAKANRFFKPYAVYGAFIPKMGSIIRNRIGGMWQTLSEVAKDKSVVKAMQDPASRAALGGQVKRLGSDIIGSIDDGLHKTFGFSRFSASDLTKTLDDVENALRSGNGSYKDAAAALRSAGKNDAAEILESGVLSGFVSSEQLLTNMARTGWKKTFTDLMNWPGAIFKGVEDRMRAGMLMDLRKQGKSLDEAARLVNDALYDYSQSGPLNRAARDLIPFWQFTAKAIPQQAQFLANNPVVLSGVKQAMLQGRDEPVYPWMEGKVNIPLGVDANGDFQYASGLGLPFEALSTIPASGADFRRNILGSSHPLIKTAYGLASGRDPYFDSPFGTYSKLPGKIEGGALGRGYNVLQGAGLLGPLDSPLRTVASAADPSKGVGLGLLDALTGVSIRSVDPNKALAQRLDAELRADPDIGQITTLYRKSDDPETKEKLRELRKAKEKVAERKRMANTD